MSKQWTLNEDIYLICWDGIESRLMANDLGRTEAAVNCRRAFLKSAKGSLRKKMALVAYGVLEDMASQLHAVQDMGVNVDWWLAGRFPTVDFTAAARPDLMPDSSAEKFDIWDCEDDGD